jgi:hypothetical protein
VLAEENNLAVSYSGTWTTSSAPNAHGGAYRYARTAGASATFTFSGARTVALLSATGPDEGRYDVYLDGVRLTPTSLDLYAPARSWHLVYVTATTTGGHTLRIRVAGTNNPSSIDTKIPVDAFVVLK